jgi:chromosome segregation ATPase
MILRRIATATTAALLVAAPMSAHAQAPRSGSDSARAAQQLQQLAAERAELKDQNAKLQQQLDDLKKKSESSSSSAKSLQQRVAELTAEAARSAADNQQNTQALEKSRAQLQELVGRFREMAQNLKNTETERSDLTAQLSTKSREFSSCVDRNIGLYTAGIEVLNRMEHRGFFTSVSEKEPFTQIQRTRMENLIDEYRQRMDELRLQGQQGNPPISGQSPASGAATKQ